MLQIPDILCPPCQTLFCIHWDSLKYAAAKMKVRWAVALQGDWCPHGEGAQVEGFPPEPHWSWDLEALTRDEMRGDAPGPGAASPRPRRQSGLNPTTQGPFRNPPRGHCPPSQKPSGTQCRDPAHPLPPSPASEPVSAFQVGKTSSLPAASL